MNKLLSIVVLLTVAFCSCHGISDRRSIRSEASDVSADIDPSTVDTIAPRDSVAVETVDVFNTARGNTKGGNKHKMEAMQMGLSYVKMVLIQIAQFVMVLKKNRDSQPPSYKIVETPWHTSPTESYGAYGSYAGHAKSSSAAAAVNYSPYAAPQVRRRR